MKRIHLTVIIVLLALGGGILVWHDMRDAREEVTKKPAERQSSPKEVGQTRDLVWYQIPELGIEFQVKKSVADELRYAYQRSIFGVNFLEMTFSTKKLSRIPDCKSRGLGTLTRLEGVPDDYDISVYLKTYKLRQMDGFFIVFGEPQIACVLPEYEDAFDAIFKENPDLVGVLATAFETIRKIQQPSDAEQAARETYQTQDLVWYQVPELGIRFKVTPDSRNNLKHAVVFNENTREFSAYFYSQSAYDFEEAHGIPCTFHKEDNSRIGMYPVCSDFALYRVNLDGNQNDSSDPICGRDTEEMRTKEYVICYAHAQASSITGDRKEYEELYRDKDFRIFLDTMEDLSQGD